MKRRDFICFKMFLCKYTHTHIHISFHLYTWFETAYCLYSIIWTILPHHLCFWNFQLVFFFSFIFFLLIRVHIWALGVTPTLSNSSVVLSRTVQPENVDFGLNLRFVSPWNTNNISPEKKIPWRLQQNLWCIFYCLKKKKKTLLQQNCAPLPAEGALYPLNRWAEAGKYFIKFFNPRVISSV